MSSAVVISQRNWHPQADSYQLDADSGTEAERKIWAPVLVLDEYPADVPDESVPTLDDVKFYVLQKGTRNFHHLTSVQVGASERLWSAQNFPGSSKKKVASRASALQLLAMTTKLHFQSFKSGQRPAAVMARLKMLRSIRGVDYNEIVYAATDEFLAAQADSSDAGFLASLDMRNQTYKGIGHKIGSMVSAVMGFLEEGETDADILDGLQRLRDILEGTAAALIAVGVIRIPKDLSGLNKDQRTKIWGYKTSIKIQGMLVAAATTKESKSSKSGTDLTKWMGSFYGPIGAAFQLLMDWRRNNSQREDQTIARAIAALQRLGFGLSPDDGDESDEDAAGPSTSTTSSPGRRQVQRKSYFVPLNPPGPSSPSSATPSTPVIGRHAAPSSPPAATSSSARGSTPLSPRRAVASTPGSAASSPASVASGSQHHSSAAPAPISAMKGLVAWLRRSLPSLPGSAMAMSPPPLTPTGMLTPASSPSSRQASASNSPAASASASSTTRGAGASTARRTATTSSSPMPKCVWWKLGPLPTTAAEVQDFVEAKYKKDGENWKFDASRASAAFMPRHHLISSEYWKRIPLKKDHIRTTLLEAGPWLGAVDSNAYADATLLALLHCPIFVQAFLDRGWYARLPTLHPARQTAALLLAGLVRLHDDQELKSICAIDLLQPIYDLPAEDGSPSMQPYNAMDGNALKFLFRLWDGVLRFVVPDLFTGTACDMRQRRCCTECGHQETIEFKQDFLSVPTVDKSVVPGGLFSRKRTETQAKEEVDMDDMLFKWRSERLDKLVRPFCTNCEKRDTTLVSSEAIGRLPSLIIFWLFMEEELPRRVRLPTGRVDLGRALREDGPSLFYEPKAYVLHQGSDLDKGHHTTFARCLSADEDTWYYHDNRTPPPTHKATEARMSNEVTPTFGRPVLLFFELGGDHSHRGMFEKTGFIVTQPDRHDIGGSTLAPRPPIRPGSLPIPLAKRARKST